MYTDEFKNYLVSHGITLEYESALSYYLRWCTQSSVNVLDVKYIDIMNFVSYNVQGGVGNGTINNRLKAMRKYYTFLSEIGKVPVTILEEVGKFKNLKVDTKVNNVLDKTEFAGLVGHGMTLFRRYKAEKIRALLFLMFYTGLRSGEVVNLKRKDFELAKNRVVVRVPTKNKTERYAYFPGEITEYLKKYFVREPEVTNAFNMTYYKIWYLISKLNTFIADGRKIHPHSLRHCFGNMLAEGDINVRVAQKLLGHKNINSTMIYYNPDAKVVERLYRARVTAVEVIKPQEAK